MCGKFVYVGLCMLSYCRLICVWEVCVFEVIVC